ncbi:unnamed protein product [Penicillium salamii]|uniref:Uncharacterized protein n=1 Tax=Penicillium salamii TaxID=1612424 RepID=A0A9W4IWH7_9EURO|nr:unnamed protein product [Penicillium salamii]CAG8356957.1 unnamed protein product [Penicillium salamii]CAG8374703.1 unnamed protein product [Penicillium salamii]CAG8377801.1 unnamed protein product [Penicillium salamii]
MGHREITPVHVPLRTSSRRPSRTDPMEAQESPGAADRQTSKAQRFFGTDITLPQEHTGWKEAQKTRQPSYIKPTSAPRQSTAFHPFPTSSEHIPKPDQNLRVRASSPLLGQDYRSQDPAPPLPKPKKIHHSGSSNALFSYFSSKESKESKLAAKSQALQPQVRNGLGIDPQVTFTNAPEPPKESKRKMRPPRIDLSVLFPKPRNPTTQTLLSPQRMVNSPSSVSTAVTDHPFDKIERPAAVGNSKGYAEASTRRESITRGEFPKHGDNSDLPSIAETRNSGWFDRPLERTVGTSEMDVALDRYAGRRSLFSRSSVYTASREHLQPEQQCPQETRKSSRRPRTPSSQPKETYLSPTSYPDSVRARGNSTSQESCKTTKSKAKSEQSSTTKKSSKSTLKNKDLQNTSMLCLSSSEDEDEDRPPTTQPPRKGSKHRDSVGTYDESEPEIYTAATARAATATAAKRFNRAHSTSSGTSRQTTQSQPPPLPVPRPRKASQSSNGKSSTTTRKTTQTRRSSGVPTIAEPDILSQFPQQPLRSPAELKEMNRRSRYIAVTRQEQDLLEAMRVRKGKVTPSLFNTNGSDRRSVVSGPSRDSFCGSDTSFLRLSNAYPPFDAQSLKSTAAYKDGMASSGSDSEQKAEAALSSPGFSADYSESLPSPATSAASPLTPTLPIHRFSPLPSPKPPPRGPPPAIPEDQKQHTRRRTDSSEAIMIDGVEPKRNLPLWSFDFDWNQERSKIATVH